MPSTFSARLALILLAAMFLQACATPRLQPGGDAPQTPRLNGQQAVMEDGHRLPMTVFQPNQNPPKGVVITVHGFTDYQRSFFELAAFLARRGYLVVTYDQRGYGATEHPGIWPGRQRMINDLRVMHSLWRKRYPDAPISWIGESMGGAVIINALVQDEPLADHAVLLAPAVWARDTMPWYQRTALWLAVHTFPGWEPTGEGLDIQPTDNIHALRSMWRDPLVQKKVRVDALWGVTNLMDDAFTADIPTGFPLLVLYGADDQVIPKKPLCRFVGREYDPTWQLVYYPEGYHMLTRDKQRGTVMVDIAGWLGAPGGDVPSGLQRDRAAWLERVCTN